MEFRKWIGEGLLWLAFVAVAVISLDDNGPDNGVAIAGLLALAAIGVRATRPVTVSASSDANGD